MPDTIQHKTKSEANTTAHGQLNDTVRVGKWMAAFWRIEDGKLVLARTTWDFPMSEFKDAIRGLGDALMEASGDIPAMPDPLHRAGGINLGDRNEVSGNGSPRVAQADSRDAGDASGEARSDIDKDQ